MKIIGLDQGTTSGYAILRGRNLLYASDFRPDGDTDAEIFHGFGFWWRDLLVNHRSSTEELHVAIEQPLVTNITAAVDSDFNGSLDFMPHPPSRRPIGTYQTFLRLYGIRAIAITVCFGMNIPCREVSNRVWRAAIYGNARLTKAKTIASAKRSAWWKTQAIKHCASIGWNIESKDAAEAALIADWLAVQLRPTAAPDLFSTATTRGQQP